MDTENVEESRNEIVELDEQIDGVWGRELDSWDDGWRVFAHSSDIGEGVATNQPLCTFAAREDALQALKEIDEDRERLKVEYPFSATGASVPPSMHWRQRRRLFWGKSMPDTCALYIEHWIGYCVVPGSHELVVAEHLRQVPAESC